jgi:hypothetical protein
MPILFSRWCITLICILSAAAASTVFAIQESAGPGIIPRMSADDYERAKACGQAGEHCAVAPYLVCPSENVRYSIRVATPFSRVAAAVFENLKAGNRGRGMDRGNANRWGTGVYVLPAERSSSAAGIERVEIERDGQTIQPLTTTVGPIAVPMPDGSSRQLARGYFAFPGEAFMPTANVTMVLTSSTGVTTCMIDRDRLRVLR